MFVEKTINFAASLGYSGLAAIMFLNTTLGFPPSELTCLFFGVNAAKGKFSIIPCIIIASISNTIGTCFLFFAARKWGKIKFYRVIDYIQSNRYLSFLKFFGFSKNAINAVLDLFNYYGYIIVFIGRNVPLIRSVISFPAGLSEMKPFIFVFFSALGITAWISIWTFLGYYIGDDIKSVIRYLLALFTFIGFSVFGKLLHSYIRTDR